MSQLPPPPRRHPWRAAPRPGPARRRAAARDGYLYLPGAAPRGPLDALRAEALAAAGARGWVAPAAAPVTPGDAAPAGWTALPGARLTGRGWDDPAFVTFQQAVLASEAFAALAEAPWLAELVGSATGQPMRPLGAHIVRCRLPGGSPPPTQPHQDSYYLGGAAGAWVAWLPLVPVPLELGPLGVLAGSHTTGAWPPAREDGTVQVGAERIWDTGPVAPGDVIVFAAALVHTAWDNQHAGGVRLSVDLRFVPQ